MTANTTANAAATAAAVPTTSGNNTDNANRITYDEFAILVRRIDRMEYSIGNIVSRVKEIFLFEKKQISFFFLI
jgi:hypothetical protein